MRTGSKTCHSEECRVLTHPPSKKGTDRLSDNPKKTLLSPSGGGEDEGEGVPCDGERLTLPLSP
jgi:hypothetical protein